eukprot:Gb_01696 [translate_table: standard]
MGSVQGHGLRPRADYRSSSLMAAEGQSSPGVSIDLPVYVKELIAGGVAGGFAKTAVAPLERIKILFQTRRGDFQSLGVWRSLGRIFQTEGILGFYRGNGASVARIVPYAALHFMTYEQYRRWIVNHYPGIGTGPIVDLLAGSVAGGTAVLCTYPLDLARTRLAYQVRGSYTTVLDNSIKSVRLQPTYSGIMDVFTKVYREGGLRGLYRGIGYHVVFSPDQSGDDQSTDKIDHSFLLQAADIDYWIEVFLTDVRCGTLSSTINGTRLPPRIAHQISIAVEFSSDTTIREHSRTSQCPSSYDAKSCRLWDRRRIKLAKEEMEPSIRKQTSPICQDQSSSYKSVPVSELCHLCSYKHASFYLPAVGYKQHPQYMLHAPWKKWPPTSVWDLVSAPVACQDFGVGSSRAMSSLDVSPDTRIKYLDG